MICNIDWKKSSMMLENINRDYLVTKYIHTTLFRKHQESTGEWNMGETFKMCLLSLTQGKEILRYPQESNSEVIREMSVGRSEKEWSLPALRGVETTDTKKEEGEAVEVEKKRNKTADRPSWDFSCSFSVNFRQSK